MKKIAWIILLLLGLSFYSHVVKYVLNGGEKLGVLTQPFKEFVLFFTTIQDLKEQFKEDADVKNGVVKSLEKTNLLKDDFYALNSAFRYDLNTWRVSLWNLKADKEELYWDIDEAKWTDKDIVPERRIIRHPILLSDSSIVFIGENTHVIYRVNKEGDLLWKATGLGYHHAISTEDDEYLWTCIRRRSFIRQFGKWSIKFRDEGIAKLDLNTGEVLFEKYISDILVDNFKMGLVLGTGNGDGDLGEDPIHLNDVEPVLKDSDWMKKGDVLMSFRNRSAVIHYRPSTNKIINVIQGNFMFQHDVDYLNDSLISVFNNNKSGVSPENFFRDSIGDMDVVLDLKSSNVSVYDLKNRKFYQPIDKVLDSLKVYSVDQSLQDYFPNLGWVLEYQNSDRLLIVDDQKVLFDGYISLDNEGRVIDLNWTRFYSNLDFLRN